MMDRLRKTIKDNKGSAIVMVIIAIAFIGILGVTIMWMSLSNYRMKVNDQHNKQGFYTAETVFDQIKSGLQEDASQAANTAYGVVMQNYNQLNEIERENTFKREFKRSLIKIVSEDPSGSSTKYKVSHLQNYIDAGLNISIDNAAKGDPIRYLGAFNVSGTHDDAGNSLSGSYDQKGKIEGTASAGPGVDETAYIVLKDIELEFTDDDDYYSQIKTDIMIEAPTTSFVDPAALPPVFKYAMLADEGINIGLGSLTINGGMYAGSNGIRIKGGNMLTVNDPNYMVSKGRIDLYNASKIKIQGGLSNNSIVYASDIRVDQAEVDIEADTRVANDLSIKGDGGGTPGAVKWIKFSGEYSGFGNSTANNNESSAIIINGWNSHIDLSGLDKLVLAGRSYVATKTVKEQYARQLDPADINKLPSDLLNTQTGILDWNQHNQDSGNIMMGESIAVKGNQLAYLVPSECIAVGSSVVEGKNPMTWSELAMFSEEQGVNSNLELVDFNRTRVPWLDDQPLKSFMPEASWNCIKQIFVPSNGEILVYFYVVLDENADMGGTDAASKYAQLYYESHRNRSNDYIGVYAKDIKLPAESSIWSAATLVSTITDSEGNLHRLSPQKLRSQETDDCERYRRTYEGFWYDLSGDPANAGRVSVSEDKVFENTIDTSKLTSFLTGLSLSGNEVVFEIPDGQPHEGFKAIVADSVSTESVTYVDNDGVAHTENKDVYVFDDTSDKVRILISTHDVLLKVDFNGIIVTDGNIYTAAGVTVSGIMNDLAKKEEVMSVLSTKIDPTKVWSDSDPYSWRPIDLFVGGDEYIGTADSGTGAGRVDINSMVNFSKWVKE